MNKSCLPNPQGPKHTSSCIESANNHVEEMAKQTTAEGAKDRKRGPYKSCLVSFSTTVLAQRRATCNCGRSDNVNCPHGCCGAAVITTKCGDHEIFQLWDSQQFHKNFEPRKYGTIRYTLTSISYLDFKTWYQSSGMNVNG